MQFGQLLSYEALRAEAAAAAASSGITQSDLARSLKVTQGAVSRALREANGSRASLQARIIEHLTDFRLVEIPERYRVERKG